MGSKWHVTNTSNICIRILQIFVTLKNLRVKQLFWPLYWPLTYHYWPLTYHYWPLIDHLLTRGTGVISLFNSLPLTCCQATILGQKFCLCPPGAALLLLPAVRSAWSQQNGWSILERYPRVKDGISLYQTIQTGK